MSENQQQDLMLPHIKQDAIVEVKIGTAFINRLHTMMHYLVEGHEEDVKLLEAKKGSEETLTLWENAVVTTTMLLQEILRVAQENDQVEYRSLKESIMGEINPNNLPQDSDQPV
jgi:hypothetical protein